MRFLWSSAVLSLSLSLLPACAVDEELTDGIDDPALPTGKADSPYSECELAQVLGWLNQPTTDVAALTAVAVPRKAATEIVAHRNGPDGLADTEDDQVFKTFGELDAVPYVGPIALGKLAAAVADKCKALPPGTADREVIFSPQTYDKSHLARIAEVIDASKRSIDLALYSFSDAAVTAALGRAVQRGVTIRLISEPASEDRKSPAGTPSARLEDLGVDVRWVNKIMHHKFAIVDGPRDNPDQAKAATLVTGSANWSSSAATKFDENTSFLRNNPEAVLRFQQEFNRLWDNSRDFAWNTSIKNIQSVSIPDTVIPDDRSLAAVYTSANFTVRPSSLGPTFTLIDGKNEVSSRLVALINDAEKSIHLASGHLRSRPVADAILARRAAVPSLDIRIYLDGQEYIGESYQAEQESRLQRCLAAPESKGKEADCYDNDYYFSFVLQKAGVPLRFKYYAYRWDYSYAPQMHHKYMIIDGRVLASGSYNLSNNAEHNTFENMVIYEAPAYGDMIAAFEANHEAIWNTGIADGGYEKLLTRIKDGPGDIPLVFDSLALDWRQVTEVKRLIRAACPAVDSQEFRAAAAAHRSCPRK